MASEQAIIVGIMALNELMELAVREYESSGKIPTYEELEARNLLTGLKIERLMKEGA